MLNASYFIRKVALWEDAQGVQDMLKPTIVTLHNFDESIDMFQSRQGFMLALSAKGEVWKWGNSSDKYVREEDIVVLSKPVKIITDTKFKYLTCNNSAVYESGNVYVWGSDKYANGILGCKEVRNIEKPERLHNLNNVKKIACSEHHVIALDNNGDMYSWGRGKYGELLMEADFTDTPTKLDNFHSIKDIACSNTLTIIQDSEDRVWYRGKLESSHCKTEYKINIINVNGMIELAQINNLSSILCNNTAIVLWSKENNKVYTYGTNMKLEELEHDHQVLSVSMTSKSVYTMVDDASEYYLHKWSMLGNEHKLTKIKIHNKFTESPRMENIGSVGMAAMSYEENIDMESIYEEISTLVEDVSPGRDLNFKYNTPHLGSIMKSLSTNSFLNKSSAFTSSFQDLLFTFQGSHDSLAETANLAFKLGGCGKNEYISRNSSKHNCRYESIGQRVKRDERFIQFYASPLSNRAYYKNKPTTIFSVYHKKNDNKENKAILQAIREDLGLKYEILLEYKHNKKEEAFGGTFAQNDCLDEYDTPRRVIPSFDNKTDGKVAYNELETQEVRQLDLSYLNDVILKEDELSQCLFSIEQKNNKNKPPLISKAIFIPEKDNCITPNHKFNTPPSLKSKSRLDLLKNSTNSLVNYLADSQQNSPYAPPLFMDRKMSIDCKENFNASPNIMTFCERPNKLDIKNDEALKKKFSQFSQNLFSNNNISMSGMLHSSLNPLSSYSPLMSSKNDLEMYAKIRKNKKNLFMTKKEKALELAYVIYIVVQRRRKEIIGDIHSYIEGRERETGEAAMKLISTFTKCANEIRNNMLVDGIRLWKEYIYQQKEQEERIKNIRRNAAHALINQIEVKITQITLRFKQGALYAIKHRMLKIVAAKKYIDCMSTILAKYEAKNTCKMFIAWKNKAELQNHKIKCIKTILNKRESSLHKLYLTKFYTNLKDMNNRHRKACELLSIVHKISAKKIFAKWVQHAANKKKQDTQAELQKLSLKILVYKQMITKKHDGLLRFIDHSKKQKHRAYLIRKISAIQYRCLRKIYFRYFQKWKIIPSVKLQKLMFKKPTFETAIQVRQRTVLKLTKFVKAKMHTLLYMRFIKWSINAKLPKPKESARRALPSMYRREVKKNTLAYKVKQSLPADDKNYKHKLKLMTTKLLCHMLVQAEKRILSDSMNAIKKGESLKRKKYKAKAPFLQNILHVIYKKRMSQSFFLISNYEKSLLYNILTIDPIRKRTSRSNKSSADTSFTSTTDNPNTSFTQKHNPLRRMFSMDTRVPHSIDVNKIVFKYK